MARSIIGEWGAEWLDEEEMYLSDAVCHSPGEEDPRQHLEPR